jgi:predicted membrane-bound mannosyltransferase
MDIAEEQGKLQEAQHELAFAQETYRRIADKLPAGTVQMAIQETATASPQFANLTPIIYIQIAREDQRPKAREIQAALGSSGYQSPGIEYVGAKSPQHSQLRYFTRTDEGPAMQKILSQLRSMGLDIDEQYIRMASGEPHALRPNQFELWLGQDYKP